MSQIENNVALTLDIDWVVLVNVSFNVRLCVQISHLRDDKKLLALHSILKVLERINRAVARMGDYSTCQTWRVSVIHYRLW